MELNEIEDFYIQYGPMVLRRCRFLLKSEEKALDAMQEVFVKVLSKRTALKAEYPSSLLYKIATNTCLNILKANQQTTALPESAETDFIYQIASHEDFVDKILTTDTLHQIFKDEAASTREMALMHYVDGLTLEETAKECGYSVSGVRKRLRKLGEKARKWQQQEGAPT